MEEIFLLTQFSLSSIFFYFLQYFLLLLKQFCDIIELQHSLLIYFVIVYLYKISNIRRKHKHLLLYYKFKQILTVKRMINQITCNSNNTIELSRGQLLQWINNLLKINYTKIQQLGSGAVYCQLLDLIYPNKVPLSKVNWKAKHEYQYVNNFKVLQQSFVKLNIMRNVDVQKLVKCKYQDNLQFLQWFKKIFDSTACANKEYDPLSRRGEKLQQKFEKVEKNQKENKVPEQKQILREQKSSLNKLQQSMIDSSNKEKINKQQRISLSPKKNVKFIGQMQSNIQQKLMDIFREGEDQKSKFYLRKISEIEHLMEDWDTDRKSSDLIGEIRKIILTVPEDNWKVEEGQFFEIQRQNIEQQTNKTSQLQTTN